MPRRLRARAGLTFVDVTCAVALLVVIAFVALVATTRTHPHVHHIRVKDAIQLRSLMQGCTQFANANGGAYPLPSVLDVANHTVNAPPHEKNTTASILSALIFQQIITPEILVSPADQGSVTVHADYEYVEPSAAANPARALWDPALRTDFTGALPAHNSYAHLQPSDARLPKWSNTMTSDQPVFSTRFPHVSAAGQPPTFNARSNACRMFGKPNEWSGNIAYADGRVPFERSLTSAARPSPTGVPDLAAFDEPADPANDFLGILIRAGKTRADFTPIWD